MFPLLFLIRLPAFFVLIDLLLFFFEGPRINKLLLLRVEIGALILLPLLNWNTSGDKNNCCITTAIFSLEHQLTVGVIILLSLFAYFYSPTEQKWHRLLPKFWSMY